MKVLNMTQHNASTEQVEAGVVEPPPHFKEKIKKWLTVDSLPSSAELKRRARMLVNEINRIKEYSDEYSNISAVMIGGAPFLMHYLEVELKNEGIQPLYAFSKRIVVEEKLEDGSVKKTAVFKHEGFVAVE